MGQVVVAGATAFCTFGTGIGNIMPSEMSCLADGKPIVTITDCQLTNITPFNMCTSLANPQVAAATAAALGVLTPQPCMLVPAGTWIPSGPMVLVGGKPCVTTDCKLICGNGLGQISIQSPGQVKVITK